MKAFVYPPLPTERDVIRILTVEPGDFDEQIRSTLTPVRFSAKPRYIALSYTWADPYPDDVPAPTISRRKEPRQQETDSHTEVPPIDSIPEPMPGAPVAGSHEANYIIVDTCEFPVERNLSLALRHLRSPTHPLPLWIYAICINQQNEKERNMYVAMMSFIYKRATMVVAWLGAREYKGQFNYVRTLQWKMGQTQHLATYISGPKRPHYDKPDQDTFARVIRSAYWTRVWVVQEFCLARELFIAYGSKLWAYECIRGWDIFENAKRDALNIRTTRLRCLELESMVRLFDARKSKHTKEMALGFLVETFSKAACGRVQDKIYGLLGLANDIIPDSDTNGDVEGPIARYIKSLDIQDEVPPDPPSGRAIFGVDYSRSLFEIWTDVLC
ncbi:heterokaryon incompatibility protein-domain-containing protein [Hypomontagnella submonticulosa]|nr:heterokaryon incompatibility protein-domain-containing protein [Hypomontagnella submonticulosa]